jgi:hypothetical protein
MAPHVAARVDFHSLHAWAVDYLRTRGVPVNVHGDKAQTAFSLAWTRVGRASTLAELGPQPQYWQDEIAYVIKGRGITSFADYALVPRHGRRTVLRRRHREAVWALYQAYESIRTERGVHDFNDLLSLALADLQDSGAKRPYAAVIVDEVQDLTLVGLRLLHALVGDTPNGLLLVGDGQQAVYPGGFRLSDAGIEIRGAGRCCAPTTATGRRSWRRPLRRSRRTASRTSTGCACRGGATSNSSTTTEWWSGSSGRRPRSTTRRWSKR